MGEGGPRVLVSRSDRSDRSDRSGSAERLLLWDGKSLAVPVVVSSSSMRKEYSV